MKSNSLKITVTVAAAWAAGAALSVASQWSAAAPPDARMTRTHAPVDTSDATQVGIASFYAKRYAGRTMADGTPMRPASNNAASLSLPLGSIARVTNLATHRSAIVVIRDRGPYVAGRIIDLSPHTAREIGLDERQGLAPVAVTPLRTMPAS